MRQLQMSWKPSSHRPLTLLQEVTNMTALHEREIPSSIVCIYCRSLPHATGNFFLLVCKILLVFSTKKTLHTNNLFLPPSNDEKDNLQSSYITIAEENFKNMKSSTSFQIYYNLTVADSPR